MKNADTNILDLPGFKFHPVIGNCRDIAMVELASFMRDLFANTESALMDFADKAESDSIRTTFIYATQKVKSRHPQVEELFQKEISKGFANFLGGRPIDYANREIRSDDTDDWNLVEKADLEDEVAVQKIATRAQSNHFKQLYPLGQRLAVVRGGKKLEERDIPTSPVHLASAFRRTVSEFDVETRTRMILYALFDKYVLRRMGTVYKRYNDLLTEAGIFPNLKPVAPTSVSTRRKDRPEQNAAVEEAAPDLPPEENAELGEELFDTISFLLSNRRKQDPAYQPAPSAMSGGGGVAPIAKPALITEIAKIQPASIADSPLGPAVENPSWGGIPDIEIDRALIENLRKTLSEERDKLFMGVDRRRIPAADLDTIELVGLLFDHILDDPLLPNAAKALLCHLHTPFLKASVIDRLILTQSHHPARQLLDQMAAAASQWIDESNLQKGIYPYLREIVDRILSEFKDDLGLFEELLKELMHDVKKREQRTGTIEKRSREAARGNDKLEHARITAAQAITSRLAGKQFPRIVTRLLEQSWTDKLILILLRDPNGEESAEWKEALSVADTLLEYALHVEEEDSSLRPSFDQLHILKRQIEEGLNALGDPNQRDIETLFDWLAGYNSLEVEDKVTTAQFGQKSSAEPAPKKVVNPSLSEENVHNLSNPEESDSELSTESITEEIRTMMSHLKKVEFGTWFEFKVSGHKGKRRVKLSWFSPLSSKYMFVDQAGVQALVIPAYTLAHEICVGNAEILGLSRVPFVDRALRAIRNKLEHSFGTTAEQP